MLNKCTLGVILLATSLFSQAGMMITPYIKAVDMEGITVTAYFSDNSSDTQTWSALTSTEAGVVNNDWSLTVAGNTYYALWTLTNIAVVQGIIGLTIHAGVENLYFDIFKSNINSTLDSGPGRDFWGSDDSVVAAFDDLLSAPDLYGTLNLTWSAELLTLGSHFAFRADIDKVKISEPSILFIFLFTLIALTGFGKQSSRK